MDSEERHDLHIEAIKQVMTGKSTIETVRVLRQWHVEEPEKLSAMLSFAEAVYDGFSRNHECLHFESEALQALEKAVRLNPKDPQALRIRSCWAYVLEEDKKKAGEYAKQYLAITPPDGYWADAARKIVADTPTGVCFIATAAFGGPDAPEVVHLRLFRDEWLCKRRLGRLFISLYNILSPPIANWLTSHSMARQVMCTVISRLSRMVAQDK